MKPTTLAAALLMTAFATTGASATTLSQVNSHDVFDGGGNVGVTIYSPDYAQGYAGGFHVTDGTTDFLAWCLDITSNLILPWDYTITSQPFSNTQTISDAVKNNILRLFEIEYPTVLAHDTNTNAGAFQLALWELLYDNHPGNVTSGTFRADVSGPGSTVENQANAFLAAVLNPATPIAAAYNLVFYEAAGEDYRWHTFYSQDLVTVTPVPLPAAGLLLGSGIAGLFAIRRRRKAAVLA